MPLRLDIKRQLSARSDRVKSVDLHPTEPWVLAALYNGNVYIWNFITQEVVKVSAALSLLPRPPPGRQCFAVSAAAVPPPPPPLPLAAAGCSAAARC